MKIDQSNTLSKISNWSPNIFMLVLKVRFGYTKFMLIYISTNVLPKLCMAFHLKLTGTSSTDDTRVKVPSFQKVIFSLQYEVFHRDATHLYFCLYENVSDCRD